MTTVDVRTRLSPWGELLPSPWRRSTQEDDAIDDALAIIYACGRRPDPTVASLTHVDIVSSTGRTAITGISPLAPARRILAATNGHPCHCGWHDLDEPHHRP